MLYYFIMKRCIDAHPHHKCPHCDSYCTVLFGKSGKKQRHLCKACRRTYNDFTKTPFAYAHFPDKLTAFIECTLKNMTLRESAIKLKISYVTLFYWRHKLLMSLKGLPVNRMKENVEIESFYMNYSRKGQKNHTCTNRLHKRAMGYFNMKSDKVCVLMVMDHFSNIYSKAICVGHMCSRHIQKSLSNLLDSSNTVCSKFIRLYRIFLKVMKIKEAKETPEINSDAIKYINSFLRWLIRFKGVATKYFNNYISLYKFIAAESFSNAYFGIETMIEAICKVSIKETYQSVTDDKVCLSDFID